ncbi:hypothetical protein FC95_GL000287 [Lentilactobacillus kefiri DSM 20587 = JCM 5818]|uniref:Uncharacterized protein n=2 Tax=Lentilactobacillus kefiri TaxID=33962 RepID=A0A8E1RJ48_LENKE|nr:hypothetical protein FC95_GL000287 [Lentilactobacillus kefiri DSM 20587 = JCM 5818]
MKPNKYLFRAFSLVGISLLSLLLVSTTGASAHDLSQYTPVTTDQNQNNNSDNNDDNNNNDNNNNGGGGYIPGGIPGGGSSNNNNGGGISAGGATAGATTNSGNVSATVSTNNQSIHGNTSAQRLGESEVDQSNQTATDSSVVNKSDDSSTSDPNDMTENHSSTSASSKSNTPLQERTRTKEVQKYKSDNYKYESSLKQESHVGHHKRFSVKNAKPGDIVTTNKTSSAGLTGHAGIVAPNGKVLTINGYGQHPVLESKTKWERMARGQNNWVKVWHEKNSAARNRASRIAMKLYHGKNYKRIKYGFGGGLGYTKRTYCSKIVYQAYAFQDSSRHSIGFKIKNPSSGVVPPYNLDNCFPRKGKFALIYKGSE